MCLHDEWVTGSRYDCYWMIRKEKANFCLTLRQNKQEAKTFEQQLKKVIAVNLSADVVDWRKKLCLIGKVLIDYIDSSEHLLKDFVVDELWSLHAIKFEYQNSTSEKKIFITNPKQSDNKTRFALFTRQFPLLHRQSSSLSRPTPHSCLLISKTVSTNKTKKEKSAIVKNAD